MRTRNKVALGSIVTILIVAGGVAGWLLRGPGTADPGPAVTAEAIRVGVPTIVSPAVLAAFAGNHYPVYWAGDRPHTTLELTLTSGNAVFVRYLPAHAQVGDHQRYLTVATYDNAVNSYAALAGAKRNVAHVTHGRLGAVIAEFKRDPLSTYFSFKGDGFQVEVFSPDPGVSRHLTDIGAIKLVGSPR